MIYRYLGINDIEELRRNHRPLFILNNVTCTDVGEYITNFLIYLKNLGVNTNILNIPKVKKTNKNEYMIVFSVRAYYKNNNQELVWMFKHIKDLPNITYSY